MSFNKGFLCGVCGPVKTAASVTKNKVKVFVCQECSGVVRAWERPKNERAGFCSGCANSGFTLAVVNRQLLRCCNVCKEVINTDTMQVVRKGAKEHEYNGK